MTPTLRIPLAMLCIAGAVAAYCVGDVRGTLAMLVVAAVLAFNIR